MRMAKLHLKLDELRIDSFATTAPNGGGGTLWGYAQEDPPFNTVGRIPSCEPCSNQATCDTCVGPNCDRVPA